MTRINIGIPVEELCDQHLVAEYRELPRMRAFAEARLARFGSAGTRPVVPTLGSGHMSYFVPYGAWLAKRFASLVVEMKLRGFAPRFDWGGYPSPFLADIPASHIALGRDLLRERIRDRLASIPRASWSSPRTRPSWTLPQLSIFPEYPNC